MLSLPSDPDFLNITYQGSYVQLAALIHINDALWDPPSPAVRQRYLDSMEDYLESAPNELKRYIGGLLHLILDEMKDAVRAASPSCYSLGRLLLLLPPRKDAPGSWAACYESRNC